MVNIRMQIHFISPYFMLYILSLNLPTLKWQFSMETWD